MKGHDNAPERHPSYYGYRGIGRRNLDFYTRVLGLRLVKKTVNFDDTGTYHFYYGDEAGQPGTILTFFPWERSAPGRFGVGETQEIVFRVPEGSLGYWTHRLVEKGLPHEAPAKRFGDTVLAFKDPDGVRLALAAVPGSADEPAWSSSEIPLEHAIRGFHSASLLVAMAAPTGAILTDIFGFTEVAREGSVIRYKTRDTTFGGIIDLREAGNFLGGRRDRHGSPHRLPRRQRRPAGGDGREAGRQSPHPGHGPEGPKLLPVRLLPRAQWNSVRDRHR